MKIVRPAGFRKIILISLVSLLLFGHGYSQPSPDQPFGGSPTGTTPDGSNGEDGTENPFDEGPCGPDPCTDPDLPIDTNVFFLVAAGVGYGLKKGWDLRRKIKRDKQLASANMIPYEGISK